jgi:hypothetical protein
MFDKARDMVWVDCIDSILLKMSVRISKLRDASKESKGIVSSMAAIVKSRFDNCAGFDVIQLEESIEEYMIVRSMYRPGSTQQTHKINTETKICTCGVWQDTQVPCVDAMAYYRLKEEKSLEQIMLNYICSFYKYEAEHDLLVKNISPVIMDTLVKDGKTLPPQYTGKRQAGRPIKKRIRKRSKFSDPSESRIKCSGCGKNGHNIKTCQARQARETAKAQSEIALEATEPLDLS